jgi:cytidylate kinase
MAHCQFVRCDLDNRIIVAVSGPVSVGKTTLCAALADLYGFAWVKTRDLVTAITGAELERRALQHAGELLEHRTGGRWISDYLLNDPVLLRADKILIDSVRLDQQVASLRAAFGKAVIHIHLTASTETLHRRYDSRRSEIRERNSYAEVQAHKIEAQIGTLERSADVIVKTEGVSASEVFNLVSRALLSRFDGALTS